MQKNYLLERATILFKGPWFNYFAEKRASKAIPLIIYLRKLVIETIPVEVIQKHEIDEAIEHQKKAVKIANKADVRIYKSAFRLEVGQEKDYKLILHMLGKIRKELIKLSGQKGGDIDTEKAIMKDFVRHFTKESKQILDKEKETERKAYFDWIAPVITSAEADTLSFMQKKAMMMKTDDISRLAAIAISYEARVIRKGSIRLRNYERKLTDALNLLNKGKKKEGEARRALEKVRNDILEDVKKEFGATFLLLKRDILLDMVILKFLSLEDDEIRQFLGTPGTVPTTPEINNQKLIKQAKGHIAEHGHMLAVGLRRLMAEEEEIAKEEDELARMAEQR